MTGRILKIGIMSLEDFKKRTIAIARGEYVWPESEPKIWFESIRSVAQVLSPENQELLKIILEHEPQSLVELERLSNRKKSNLSRTLRTMETFGIVELPMHKGKLVPKVKATDFQLEFGLNSSAG
jgi:predicted transcriptional regulator